MCTPPGGHADAQQTALGDQATAIQCSRYFCVRSDNHIFNPPP
jgi:hypothetical protein